MGKKKRCFFFFPYTYTKTFNLSFIGSIHFLLLLAFITFFFLSQLTFLSQISKYSASHISPVVVVERVTTANWSPAPSRIRTQNRNILRELHPNGLLPCSNILLAKAQSTAGLQRGIQNKVMLAVL